MPDKRYNRYLIVKGCAGLGNRLFTLAEAIAYAKETNRKLYVDWSDGQFGDFGENVFYNYFTLNNFNAGVNLLQDLALENYTIYPESYKGHLKSKIYDLFTFNRVPGDGLLKRIVSKIFPELSRGYWKLKAGKKVKKGLFGFLKDINSSENLKTGGVLKLGLKEDIVIFADFVPSGKENVIIEEITLNADLTLKVDIFSNKWNLNAGIVGVHVRFSDKKPTKQLDELFDKVNKLMKMSSLKGIFLATDNQMVLKAFKARFNLVITIDKAMPKDSEKEGLHRINYNSDEKGEDKRIMFEQSILDMWLLSKCEYLFYQGNSSFSQISRVLHQHPENCFDWQA